MNNMRQSILCVICVFLFAYVFFVQFNLYDKYKNKSLMSKSVAYTVLILLSAMFGVLVGMLIDIGITNLTSNNTVNSYSPVSQTYYSPSAPSYSTPYTSSMSYSPYKLYTSPTSSLSSPQSYSESNIETPVVQNANPSDLYNI